MIRICWPENGDGNNYWCYFSPWLQQSLPIETLSLVYLLAEECENKDFKNGGNLTAFQCQVSVEVDNKKKAEY